MKTTTPVERFTKTELRKMLNVSTMTNVAKMAFKAGNAKEELMDAGLLLGYTRQGVNDAIRAAGFRTRVERSDKGITLRLRISKLVEEAKTLEQKLAQEGGSSPSQQ